MMRVLRAELLKFRTTAGPWVVLLVALLFTALGIIGTFLRQVSTHHTVFTAPLSEHGLRNLVGAGYTGGIVMAPILGVLCVTSEYRHKVITTTFLVTPRRAQVLVAKVLASAIWGVLLCLATLALVAALGIPLLVTQGGSLSAMADQVAPVVPGLLGAFALLAVFGAGVGVLVKNQVAGVILTIGGTIALEPIIVALVRTLLHADLNWLPSEATAALAGGLTRGGGTGLAAATRLLSWWLGGLALLAWGIGTAVLGYFTTFRRDVT
jgi:hypothetical protein